MMNRLRFCCVLALPPFLTGCFIAPAPSNVPAYKVWFFQVCIPKNEAEDARTAALVASRPPKARTTTGQPVYFGVVEATISGADGTVFIIQDGAGAESKKKHYLFPIKMGVKHEWTSWLDPAQLDYHYPASMDRFKRFTPLDPSEIPTAPKIRWVYDYNGTYTTKWSQMSIPPC